MVARSRRSVVAATSTALLLIAIVSFAAIGRSGAAVDTSAPALVALSIAPATIDTSSGPVVVTITAHLTDQTSPSIGGSVPLSRVILTGPGGRQQAIAYLSQAQRVSGTATDGVYISTLTIPWHAEPGAWSASAVLVDIAGNTQTLSAANLASAGFPSVVNQTGPGDTSAPQLVALGIAPSTVDTSLQSATITVTAHVVDNLSGVSDGVAKAASQVVLQGPSGAHHARATLSIDHRTAGNALDATFVVAVTLPRWSEQGVWTVQSVTVVDQVGNQQTLTAPGVTFTQTGIGDTSAPQFRSFSLSPTTADVRASSASIVMRARIVDDLSGAADGLVDSPTTVVFASPSGWQRLTVPFGAAQRVSGNQLDANYSMSAIVPAHAEPGLWTMTDAWPTDQAGNVGHLVASDWAAAGFPNSFTVVSDTPPVTGPTLPPVSSTTSTSIGSVFTTTTDPFGTTTTVDPNATTTTDPFGTTTTVDPNATTTTVDPNATTTVDPNATTTTVDPNATTTTDPFGTTTSSTVAGGSGGTTTTTTDPVQSGSSGPPHVRHANGYWFATRAGRVVGFGGAASTSVASAGIAGNDRVVGIATTPTGLGYWLATARGDVRPFGDAHSYGSMAGRSLARPIVGIAATPDGRGYWLVAADGGIFSFGDAHFLGSMGATHLNQPVVGMTAAPSGRGYWMVARDGGIFSFGTAHFFGSTGAIRLNQPITGMSASPTARGYWFVAADGGIFSFGDAHFYGSMASSFSPVVGMAVRAS